MIAIIDYGMGNLFSIANALDYLGFKYIITKDKKEIEKSRSLILPGVGAFPDAMKMLDKSGLSDLIVKQTEIKPLLGICLGAQLLFDRSFENEETNGLSLINGAVSLIQTEGLKIPHMGWNNLRITGAHPLLSGLKEGSWAYFVHSYKIETDASFILAFCEYGEKIPAVVGFGNVFGTQFHPEKSGEAGLLLLKNFGGML